MKTCCKKRNEVLASLFPGVDTTRIEGEFVPEADEPEKPYEYHGEFRLVNVPPTRLQKMLRENLTASDKDAVQLALRAWGKMGGIRDDGTEAGEPYRGEARTAQVFSSIREMVANVKPVDAIIAVSLSSPGQGISRLTSEPHWLGIFDFDELEIGLKELPNETMGNEETQTF